MDAGKDDAARLRIGRHGAVALAPDDTINHRQIAQRLLARLPGAVEIVQALVEVQHHAPAGIVAVPVAGADNLLRVAEKQATQLFHRHE